MFNEDEIIIFMFSAFAGFWSTWSDWSFCAAVCSIGNWTRTRNFTLFPAGPNSQATDADYCEYDVDSCNMLSYCKGNDYYIMLYLK